MKKIITQRKYEKEKISLKFEMKKIGCKPENLINFEIGENRC